MPAVARVGVDQVASGVITGPGSATVFVDGLPASVIGDTVSAHGEPPHTTPTVATGSSTVFVDGKPLTLQGISTVSCGHSVSTGSATVSAS